MIARLSDLLFRISNDVRGVGKHVTMVQSQLEQVAKSQRELLDEMNHNMHDFVVREATRGGKMTQEPLILRDTLKELNKIHKDPTLVHVTFQEEKEKRKKIGHCTLLVNLK